MKFLVLAGLVAFAPASSLLAQERGREPNSSWATSPPTSRASLYTLDTPVQDIAADAKGRAVLDKDLPTLFSHPMYESFKALSLSQLQAYAPDRMTDALLTTVATDLAAVK